jgi:phytoene dehydrogenase-like protein
MTKKVDSIVVGAGAGGLAMALFLAQTGKKVIIIEKATRPGGALGSFKKRGFNLDAGFHFTGGLQDGGIFDNILKLFGVRDMIQPVFLNRDAANIFHFTASDKTIEFPYGTDRIIKKLKADFPGESNAIETYFATVKRICDNTPTLQIESLHVIPKPIQEDYITLQEFLDSLTKNRLLKEVLNTLVMCHGSAPSEISMADNSRLCQGFYESICTIAGGGASLVNAFRKQLHHYNVEIISSDQIVEMADVKDKKVGRFILHSGIELESDICVFTIPPASILEILPKENFPPAFFNRVESFEYTPGFFTVFAALNPETTPVCADSITSLYPVDDINALSLPGWKGPGALAMMHSKSGTSNVLTAFEPIYWEQVKQWDKTATGARPRDYSQWKDAKTNEIISRITNCFPSYKGKLDLVTSSTPLTYRDYLYHNNGAAYGIKQKVNQFNLLGQLRLKNLFVAGQSAILPGVLGTIMASLLIGRNIIGQQEFKDYLKKNSA